MAVVSPNTVSSSLLDCGMLRHSCKYSFLRTVAGGVPEVKMFVL